MLLVGTPRDPEFATDSGAVHVYIRGPSGWRPWGKLTPDPQPATAHFGSSVAARGNDVFVGAPWSGANGAFSGSIYLFRRSGAAFTQVAQLSPSDGDTEDTFGSDMAIDGSTLVVSAEADDDAAPFAGSAYVFEEQSGAWVETAKLLPMGLEATENLGRSVAVAGDVIAIGAPRHGRGGACFLYHRTAAKWQFRAEIHPYDDSPDEFVGTGDQFGAWLSIANDTLAVGAPRHDLSGIDSGAVYAFSIAGDLCATLSSPKRFSYGKQTFQFSRNSGHGGHFYWLIGSMSGSSTGFTFGGHRIPLNLDAYLLSTAMHPNSGWFSENLGRLDGLGQANVNLIIPPGELMSLMGLELDHAVLEGTPTNLEHVSNVVRMRIGSP